MSEYEIVNKRYLIAGSIVFEPDSRHIYRSNKMTEHIAVKYDLGENSKEILLALIESDTCMSPEELLEEVWRRKKQIEVDITSVRQAISKLRKNLKLVEPKIEIVKTIPRKGYFLDADVELIKNGPIHTEAVENKEYKRSNLLKLSILLVVFYALFFIYHRQKQPEESVFSEVENMNLTDLKVMQSKDNPVEQSLLPFFRGCISQLKLLDAETVIIYSTTEGVISLTAFYETPIKKATTYRLVLIKNIDKGGSECVF